MWGILQRKWKLQGAHGWAYQSCQLSLPHLYSKFQATATVCRPPQGKCSDTDNSCRHELSVPNPTFQWWDAHHDWQLLYVEKDFQVVRWQLRQSFSEDPCLHITVTNCGEHPTTAMVDYMGWSHMSPTVRYQPTTCLSKHFKVSTITSLPYCGISTFGNFKFTYRHSILYFLLCERLHFCSITLPPFFSIPKHVIFASLPDLLNKVTIRILNQPS